MTRNQRPLPVTIIGWVYIAVGTIGFAYHLNEFRHRSAFQSDEVWIELTEFLALLCGIFLLRGHNWARWLAVAWMGFHVVLSAFHNVGELIIHCLFCALIACLLFRPAGARYFRKQP